MAIAQEEILTEAPLTEARYTSLDIDAVRANALGRFHVADSVVSEVAELESVGFDVRFVDSPDPHGLSDEAQAAVDARVEELENSSTGYREFREPPAMSIWAKLTKNAIALHTLYNASTARTLGEGIAADAYERPSIPVKESVNGNGASKTVLISAHEAMRRKKPARADGIVERYEAFLDTEIDDESRTFYQGTMDARGVRTRAYTARDMITDHLSAPRYEGRDDIVFASYACGAAGPAFGYRKPIQDLGGGRDIGTFHLLDQDPMALASADAIGEDLGVRDRINIVYADLLLNDFTKDIEPGSVDIGELLGLFEYIDRDKTIGTLVEELREMDIELDREFSDEELEITPAAFILKQVGKTVRAGGQIIFGNMLGERPQQKFFNDVVGWPPLKQSSITDVLAVIQEAGYDLANVSVRIPSREGLYAVYSIDIPEGEPEEVIPTIPRATDKVGRVGVSSLAA